VPDPEGEHLLALARGPEGYRRLCRVISGAHLRGEEKGRPVYDHEELVDELAGHVLVLTGCRKGAVRAALERDGLAAAAEALAGLVDRYGREHVVVELVDQAMPLDSTRNDLLFALAAEHGLAVVATTAAHYAHPARGRLAAAMAAVRARRGLDEMAGWLPPAATAGLRSGAEMARRFVRYPGVVHRAALLGMECAFDLELIAPKLPPFPVPPGHTEASWLRHLTEHGAHHRYGPREQHPAAWRQIDHELAIITDLGFPGYFLVVHDIVAVATDRGILCQGRGSAANSAVCFALGITNVDAVRHELLFERFLSPSRTGHPPDIDIDFEAGRREEVIQYVYDRYGRTHAAQVATVVTYRARSAVRDAARALGYAPGAQDAWSKSLDGWGPVAAALAEPDQPIPRRVLELARQFESLPRHLGVHSGGMVICDRPIGEVIPVEWARADGRTVLQLDKDDVAAIGLVKFDLLGLGMLSAIRYALDLITDHHDTTVELWRLDLEDQAVYDMLCAADTVGVFQVESRAQQGTLPRLRPRSFWDLAVEVALIRPGPIQGGSVHPYLRRRRGEPWQHDHPLLARALDKTLGVPLFQEQIMHIAMDAAGFSAADADELRRAMGAKRSGRKMELLRERFYKGLSTNDITGELADRIFLQVKAFSGYGFPQSHALAFAHIVFQSAWLKLNYPAAFCAALLRAQPMGFYSPQTLVADARRHGVRIRGVDLNTSRMEADLEADPGSAGGHAVRIGLGVVRGVGEETAQRIVAERDRGGPYTAIDELTRRVRLTLPQVEALASAGALAPLESSRRGALWSAGAAARERPDALPGTAMLTPAPALPGMTPWELMAADLRFTGLSPDGHPVQLLRAHLDTLDVLPAVALGGVEHGTRVMVGGAITHIQRPPTAGGVTFLNLEDETGMVNVVIPEGLWATCRPTVRGSNAVIVRGVVESASGAVNLLADRITALEVHEQGAGRKRG
jgi:error-prone DNA polymerase